MFLTDCLILIVSSKVIQKQKQNKIDSNQINRARSSLNYNLVELAFCNHESNVSSHQEDDILYVFSVPQKR